MCYSYVFPLICYSKYYSCHSYLLLLCVTLMCHSYVLLLCVTLICYPFVFLLCGTHTYVILLCVLLCVTLHKGSAKRTGCLHLGARAIYVIHYWAGQRL